jgi:hypothetical protein
MVARTLAVLSVAFVLNGCITHSKAPSVAAEDPLIWGRIDCQRGEGNAALQQAFEQAKVTCIARGESARAVDGSAGNNRCMNEQGYILRTKTEHVAVCQPIEERRKPSVNR